MNLWSLVTKLIISLGLVTTNVHYIPSINLVEDNSQVIIEQQVLENFKNYPNKKDNKSLGVKIGSTSAIVMDVNTKAILWQKNAHEVRSLASITKLMTALVFLDTNPQWSNLVTMNRSDERNGGTAHILRGKKVRVKDLFNVSLIASDNNAINALVRSTGIASEDYLDLMNNKAKELNLENTNFVDFTGLNDKNKSTAFDILKLSQEAFTKEEIVEVTKKKIYSFYDDTGKYYKILSTNKLLNSYLNVIAGKTGFTNAAGYCLVSEIENEYGHKILIVILNAESDDHRFQDLKILAGWILENYFWSD